MRCADRGITRVPAEAVPDRVGGRYALVVGVNDYEDRFPTLRNAVNDALAVQRRLTDDFGFTVTTLLDAQAGSGAVATVLSRWRADLRAQDAVVVFFAGHGASRTGADGTPEGYLLAADAGPDPRTWLSEAWLVTEASALRAGRALLLLDACYAGTALRLSDAVQPGARQDQALAILVAGTERQPVLDGGPGTHSVFTRALLDGLDGLADAGQAPDGVVTARELITYVCSEVPWRSRLRLPPDQPAQTPVGGAIRARPDGVEFAFLPRGPRLPATVLRNLYSLQAEDRVAAAHQLRALRGTTTAHLAAAELVRLLRGGPGDGEGREGASGGGGEGRGGDGGEAGERVQAGEVVEVRRAAVESLGAMGEPCGFEVLTEVLADHNAGPEVRGAAAEALGALVRTAGAAHPDAAAAERPAAVETLAGLVEGAGENDVREAAKSGLAHVPAVGPDLARRLRGPGRRRRAQVADALACVGMHHVDDDDAWPRLRPGPALLRRYHLARRRLTPWLSSAMGDAGAVGVAGAIGLALAYLPLTVVVVAGIPGGLRLYGPAVVAVCAVPGLVAGLALFAVPTAGSAASRRGSLSSRALGGVVAGLVVAAALWVPNWFLGVGCGAEGCPPESALLWLVPGLVLGPALGVTTATLRPAPGWSGGVPWGAGAVVLVAAVGSVLVRLPPSLTTGRVEPRTAELLAWGIGGLLLGLALVIGWPSGEPREPLARGGPR